MLHQGTEFQNCRLPSDRTNLDPWDQYSDSQIWEALEKTHIKEMVSDKTVKRCGRRLISWITPL